MIDQVQKTRIDRILEKLALVRSRGLNCFGSEKHLFRLNKPLSEETIANFESQHRIELPADYRAFLKYAGNGGAGPYYGIYRLETWNEFADWVEDNRSPEFLSLPSPLYLDLPREDDWEEKLDCESPYQGAISIGTQGCTYSMLLIVSGPYSGRVLYVDADGQPPYMVRNQDFLEWYERWLDELLGGYDTGWFGFGIGGTEEYLLEVVEQASSEKERAEAVEAMCRLPELSEKVQQCIQNLLSAPDETVRATACNAVRSCSVPDTQEAIVPLLDDDSPAVRRQAVLTLMETDPIRWNKHVTLRLWDDDEDVANTAFSRMKDAESLGRDDLLKIVQKSLHGSLRSYAAHAMEWQRQDESLLVSLLRDENAQVRFYAVLGLRSIKSIASVPTIIEIFESEKEPRFVSNILTTLGELGGKEAKKTLLAWTYDADDFHRLEAIDGLCKLGDVRVANVARKMLKEKRSPERRDEKGWLSRSHAKSISQLVAESLKKSPNRSLRSIVSKRKWWPW